MRLAIQILLVGSIGLLIGCAEVSKDEIDSQVATIVERTVSTEALTPTPTATTVATSLPTQVPTPVALPTQIQPMETPVPITGETISHGMFNLESNEGKPVLVNFWFPSCPPCRTEMPVIQAAFERYGDQIAFIGVQNLGLDTPAKGAAFVEELGVTYPSMPDINSRTQVDYGVISFPTTVFLDRNHHIARKWTGVIGEQQLLGQLDALLTPTPIPTATATASERYETLVHQYQFCTSIGVYWGGKLELDAYQRATQLVAINDVLTEYPDSFQAPVSRFVTSELDALWGDEFEIDLENYYPRSETLDALDQLQEICVPIAIEKQGIEEARQ